MSVHAVLHLYLYTYVAESKIAITATEETRLCHIHVIYGPWYNEVISNALALRSTDALPTDIFTSSTAHYSVYSEMSWLL